MNLFLLLHHKIRKKECRVRTLTLSHAFALNRVKYVIEFRIAISKTISAAIRSATTTGTRTEEQHHSSAVYFTAGNRGIACATSPKFRHFVVWRDRSAPTTPLSTSRLKSLPSRCYLLYTDRTDGLVSFVAFCKKQPLNIAVRLSKTIRRQERRRPVE